MVELTNRGMILFAVRDEMGPWHTFSLSRDAAKELAALLVGSATADGDSPPPR
jgi:hypothetical protein